MRRGRVPRTDNAVAVRVTTPFALINLPTHKTGPAQGRKDAATGFVKAVITRAARPAKSPPRKITIADVASPISVILQPRMPCGVFFGQAGNASSAHQE
jgi:hypothetical protein